MTEYIGRETIAEDFERCNSINPEWTPQRIKTLIFRQNAADVAPVVHGRWIQHKYFYSPARDNACAGDCYWTYNHMCSLCKEIEDGIKNYCPNCGAKMDGDNND